MDADRGARCPKCSAYAGLEASFCPRCGAPLARPSDARANQPDSRHHIDVSVVQPRRSVMHHVLRLLFAVWLVAYPEVSCGPVLLGAANGGTAGGAVALGGLILGGVFIVPCLVGLLVLGLLARMAG
jgi:hypothetical protein